MASPAPDESLLRAGFQLGYTYTRSPGPLIGRFLAALQQRRLFGRRAADGTVLFPPTEYDPRDSEATTEWVEVGDRGSLQHWTWIAQPRPHHLLQRPFAFGLILLDGADTPFLHLVDVPGPEALSRGMRLRVRWAHESRGAITDIACFEPDGEAPA